MIRIVTVGGLFRMLAIFGNATPMFEEKRGFEMGKKNKLLWAYPKKIRVPLLESTFDLLVCSMPLEV